MNRRQYPAFSLCAYVGNLDQLNDSLTQGLRRIKMTGDVKTTENPFRLTIALASHAVAQLKPEQIFGENNPIIAINHPLNGSTASTGWVGESYKAGGTIFMGINPGGGTKAKTQEPEDDAKLYGLLRNFKQAQRQNEILDAFMRLNKGYMEIQPRHKIYSNLIAIFLEKLRLNINDTAFLNLVPFRTREDKPPPKASFLPAWTLATRGQLDAFKPSRVFLLGQKVSQAITPFQNAFSQTKFVTVYRTNGDTYLEPRTKDLLSTLKPD
jgi:hypothetical protein